MKNILHIAVACATIFACTASANAGPILVSDSGGIAGYGYGYSNWDNFTNALNAASGNMVSVTPNLNNLGFMLGFDALLVDQRWVGGSLGATEVANITAFIATGRRVLMIGENSSWTSWNNQILGIVGGAFVGQSSAVANAVVVNSLTAGAPSFNLPTAGLAAGGTALYAPNFATLWGAGNVLTVLDVNVWSDSVSANGTQFGINVANWLAVPFVGSAVPEPMSVALFGIGASILGAARLRRRRTTTVA